MNLRSNWLFLLALLAACDSPQPPVPPVQEAIAVQPIVRGAGGPSEVLGIAVRAGIGGVMIVGMDLDGPAAVAGALVGDFITAVNGASVSSERDLAGLVSAASRGGNVTLDLWRQGERRQALIAVRSAPAEVAADAPPPGGPELLGVYVRELPEATLKSLGVAYGLMVTKVRAPADRSRLQPGDVIVGVNQTKIRSLDEFNRLIAEPQKGAVAFLVRRADADLYISLDVRSTRNGASSGASRAPPDEGFKARRPATGTPLRT